MSDLFDDGHPFEKGTYSARDIEVLEGLEPVRLRPGMYIGGTDERALHHLVAEVLDNSMDEAVAGYASRISVSLNADGSVAITDNGRGIPVDPHPKFKDKSALEVILSTLHSGGKFSGKNYATSGGLHGVGISVVNALSESLVMDVWRDKTHWQQSFSKGQTLGPIQKMGAAPNRRGTRATFLPDPEIFGKAAKFNAKTLFGMVRSKAYLQRGVEIRWAAAPAQVKGTDVPAEATFHFPGGLSDYLTHTLEGREKLIDKMFAGEADFAEDAGRMEWALTWVDRGEGLNQTYVNTIPTPLGGSHENGLRSGLLRAFRQFGEMAGIKKAASVTADDLLGGSCLMMSVFIREPQFQGQTKERLTTTAATRLVDTVIKEQFDHWLAANAKDAKAVLDSAILRAEERRRKKDEKELGRKAAGRRMRLPGKLADCARRAREGTELFIVEGDSAGGSAKQARNRETQAILPLRGKILNVASATRDKLKANVELTDLTQALGCGQGKAFKLDDLRYERVVIMTDADVDGAHIASLLMTFFYKEMRPLIEEGYLFLAAPPLYRLSQGGKTIYATDDRHKDELMETSFRSNGKVDISRFKGLGEMSPAQLKVTTMDPKTRTLLQVAVPDVALLEAVSEEQNAIARQLEDSLTDYKLTENRLESLMGKKPEGRFRYIQDNAAFADNLDV